MKARFTHYRHPAPTEDLERFQHTVRLAQHAVPFRIKAWPSAVTRCDLVEPLEVKDGERPTWAILTIGWAICSSRDQFSRKKGRLISESRARHKLDRL